MKLKINGNGFKDLENPNVWYSNENSDVIQWLADGNMPEPEFSDEEIAIKESTQYSRDRKAEYNKLNQFEMQYDDSINGTTTWQDAILAIKAKYPKPIVQGE